jgi:hypothetical protein
MAQMSRADTALAALMVLASPGGSGLGRQRPPVQCSATGEPATDRLVPPNAQASCLAGATTAVKPDM